MTNDTIPIPNTDLRAPAENYDVGFQTPGKSYAELYNDLLIEAFSRLPTAAETSYDHVVTTTSELEATFGGLSRGESVYIASPQTPYRPSGWLDIDADGVTVVGESWFAGNGGTLITAADGADAGGIRIGHNAPVSGVRVSGVGFDGNYPSQSGLYLHGFGAFDATNCTIERCHARSLAPYHVHTTGGSGISIEHTAEHITVHGNWIHDTGDRGIQCSGQNVTITNNHCSNGYDRSFALNNRDSRDRNDYGASNVLLAGNVGHDNPSGSIIGLARVPNQTMQNIIIANNIGYGAMRSFIHTFTNPDGLPEHWERIVIAGNVGEGDGAQGIRVGRNQSGTYEDVQVLGNQIYSPNPAGIEVTANVTGVTVAGNTVVDAGLGGGEPGINIVGPAQAIVGLNNVRNAGAAGIRVTSQGAIVGLNRTAGSATVGIEDAGDSNAYVANITEKGFAGTAGVNSEKVANIVF